MPSSLSPAGVMTRVERGQLELRSPRLRSSSSSHCQVPRRTLEPEHVSVQPGGAPRWPHQGRARAGSRSSGSTPVMVGGKARSARRRASEGAGQRTTEARLGCACAAGMAIESGPGGQERRAPLNIWVVSSFRSRASPRVLSPPSAGSTPRKLAQPRTVNVTWTSPTALSVPAGSAALSLPRRLSI